MRCGREGAEALRAVATAEATRWAATENEAAMVVGEGGDATARVAAVARE